MSPHAVILIDPENYADSVGSVVGAAPGASSFVMLPILLADPEDPGLEAVRRMPGVVDTALADDLILSMLEGLDWAAMLCVGLLDDWAVGGVSPGERYPNVFNEPTGVEAPSAVCTAINISLTPPDEATAPTLPTDIINHATRVLPKLAVPVVAAGNHYEQGLPFETVSPWAEPDWVLSVGATSDRAGEVEWPRSARGSSANPQVGPDILAWGQDPYSAEGFGTSFAAARVSRMAILCRAWLFEVAANIDRLAGQAFGVPLVGAAGVDRELRETPGPRAWEYSALPVLASAPGALEHGDLNELATALKGPDAIQATRALLHEAGRTTSPGKGVRLSAPSLTPERLELFLDGISAERLVKLVNLGISIEAPSTESLFRPGTAYLLRRLIWQTMPGWGWDIDTSTPRMRPIRREQM